MTIPEILGLIFMHYIADFIFQDQEWSIKKSKNNRYLLNHVFTYSLLIWCYIFVLSDFSLYLSFYFWIITFIFHFVTDYITSRIVSKRFENNYLGSKIPNFGAFSIIGIDQVLHYIQLFLTYKLLL